ncbi:MAG: hypothetical protein ACKOAD_08640 [Gammaproteobacteria bacterium]
MFLNVLKIRNRLDFSILLGNSLDHFDTALYVLLLPVLTPAFFPNYSQNQGLLIGYAIFASSAITRPLGAILFGMIAKYKGPLKGLSYSLMAAALTNVFLAILPGHSKCGFFSAILFVFLRFLRGIFTAGESTIAKLYIMEGKSHKEAFHASYYYPTSSMLGNCLAAFMSYLWVYQQGITDAWRYCFLFSGLIGICGYGIRKQAIKIDSVLDGLNAKIVEKTPYNGINTKKFLQNILQYKRPFVKIALTTGLSHLTALLPFSIFNIIVPMMVTGISVETMVFFNTCLLFLDLLLIPVLGRCLINYSPSKITQIAAVSLGLSLPILFFYIDAGSSVFYITFVRFWIVFLGVVFLCPQHLYYKNLFSKQTESDQYITVGLGNAIGSALFGKLSPLIMFGIYQQTQSLFYIGLYAGIFSLMTFAAILVKD